MNKQTKLIFTALALSVATNAMAIPCEHAMNESESRALLSRMLEYAFIEHWSFRHTAAPGASCKEEGEYRIDPPHVDYHSVTVNPVSALLSKHQFVRLFDGYPGVIYSDTTDGGQYYISCRREKVMPEIAVRLLLVQSDVTIGYDNGPVSQSVFFIVPDVRIVLPNILRGLIKEEVEVANVTRVVESNDSAVSGHSENVVLIRGTDLNLARVAKQLHASYSGMRGDSCVFPVVARVVSSISRSDDVSSDAFAVVGHSLGGAVAQFVATDQHEHPNSYHRKFEAYAFNAVGLPDGTNKTIDQLDNYTVNGDWLYFLSPILGQVKAGVQVVYYPDDPLWRPGRRHGIRAVQESLCRCWGDVGSVVVEKE